MEVISDSEKENQVGNCLGDNKFNNARRSGRKPQAIKDYTESVDEAATYEPREDNIDL